MGLIERHHFSHFSRRIKRPKRKHSGTQLIRISSFRTPCQADAERVTALFPCQAAEVQCSCGVHRRTSWRVPRRASFSAYGNRFVLGSAWARERNAGRSIETPCQPYSRVQSRRQNLEEGCDQTSTNPELQEPGPCRRQSRSSNGSDRPQRYWQEQFRGGPSIFTRLCRSPT